MSGFRCGSRRAWRRLEASPETWSGGIEWIISRFRFQIGRGRLFAEIYLVKASFLSLQDARAGRGGAGSDARIGREGAL